MQHERAYGVERRGVWQRLAKHLVYNKSVGRMT